MFPFSFEWVWDTAHLVFMGGLWYAVAILGMGLTYVVVKTIIDTFGEDSGDNGHH